MRLCLMKWQVTKGYENEKWILMVLVVDHDVLELEPGKFPEVMRFMINWGTLKQCALLRIFKGITATIFHC